MALAACGQAQGARVPAAPLAAFPPSHLAAAERAEAPPPLLPARPPLRLAIPKLGIQARAEAIGFLQVPRDPADVGWFETGPAPGEGGDAVIDGHLDWTTGPAVFWELHRLGAGDQVLVEGAGGRRLAFAVDAVYTVPYDSIPPAWLYARQGEPQLTLITCAGAWDRAAGVYRERLLVHTRLVPSAAV
jgi:LPXTG-site transpeptidase (sortase) family protein